MNRSIFQIWQFRLKKYAYSLFFSFFILFFVNFDFYVDCISFRGLNNNLLKEIKYNGVTVNCSKELPESSVKTSLDIFLNNYNKQKTKYSLCKYFKLIDNRPVIFDKWSCYSHPNLFFGVYNELYFNFQLSHTKFNDSFELIDMEDIIGDKKNQFICNKINIYSQNLYNQFLNYNNLKDNIYSPFTNNSPDKFQNFIELYNNYFKNLIDTAIKK